MYSMQILQNGGAKAARLFLDVRKIPCLIRKRKYCCAINYPDCFRNPNGNPNIGRKIFNNIAYLIFL